MIALPGTVLKTLRILVGLLVYSLPNLYRVSKAKITMNRKKKEQKIQKHMQRYNDGGCFQVSNDYKHPMAHP